MNGGRIGGRNRLASGSTGWCKATACRSVAFPTACYLGLLAMLTPFGGCALRLETAAGDSWSMGLSRRTVKLEPLDHETALARENSQAAPLNFAFIPFGIEAGLGWQCQARGFVLANSVTNRFLSPSGVGFGSVDGWFFGILHYRIPRENNRVRLLVNSFKGGAFRVANADPHLIIGFSRTTATTVLAENTSGNVEFEFSRTPDFSYSAQPIALP